MTKNTKLISDDELEYHIKYDKKKNEESTPPVDEKIKILSIWVFETYTPSNIENFHRGVEKLGWEKQFWSINSDFQDKIDDMRFQSFASGWLNLGFVVDKSQTNAWPGTKKADLPDGISHLKLTILQYLPSTTILACQFILSDNLSSSIEETLRDNYKSYNEPTRSGYLTHDVINQKREAVTLIRTYLKDLCSSWIKSNFPGLFSSGELDGHFPTSELLTFEKFDPSVEGNNKQHDNYLSILNLAHNFDTWQCDQLENIYMRPREDRDSIDKFNIVLFCNVNKALTNQDISHYGDNQQSRLIAYLSYLNPTFGVWVLSVIANTYDRSLAIMRDSFGEVGDLDSSYSFKKLINLERTFLNIKRNTIPFVYELKEHCKYKRHFLHDVYEFKAVHEMQQKSPPLFESLRRNLLALSKHLESNTNSVESTAKACRQIASVNSSNRLAKTNISLQKSMSWMTLIMLILTAIAALSSIDKMKQIVTSLKQVIN